MNNKCQYCNKEFTPKRNDAKFCSQSCKSKFWNDKKRTVQQIEPPSPPALHATLKGVLSNNETPNEAIISPKDTLKEVKVETQEYILLKNELNVNRKNEQEIATRYNELVKKYNLIASSNGLPVIVFGALSGALIAGLASEHKSRHAIGGGIGIVCGLIINEITKDDRKKDKKLQLKEIMLGIEKLKGKYTDIKRQETIIIEKMESITRYEIKLMPPFLSKHKVYVDELLGIKRQTVNEASLTINKELNGKINVYDTDKHTDNQVFKTINETENHHTPNDKIISSRQLAAYDFKKFDFQNKWNDLIGKPAIVFHLAIHGKPGEGKSTFAMQFANYLADNFGKVVYISGEEGFSSTMKDKIKLVNALSPHLFIADLKKYDDIIREIPVGQYHFIIIDSLNNMGVDAEKLNVLKSKHKESAMITISQATKDGKMRGSLEIIHDADIEIKVENGIATTHKNRFKEKGKELRVF